MPYIFINPFRCQLRCFQRFQFLSSFFNGAVESRVTVVFDFYLHAQKSPWLPHLLIHISVDNAAVESRITVVFDFYLHAQKSPWLPHLLIHISVDNAAVESRVTVVFDFYLHAQKSPWLPQLLIHISVDNAAVDSEIFAQFVQNVPLKTGPLSPFRRTSGPVLSGTRCILPLRCFFFGSWHYI
jgi:hypothetical protein